MEGIKEIGAITFQINPMFRVLKKQQKKQQKNPTIHEKQINVN